MWSQTATPRQQADYITEALIEFKNRTGMIVDGNHESRITHLTSTFILEPITKELGGYHKSSG